LRAAMIFMITKGSTEMLEQVSKIASKGETQVETPQTPRHKANSKYFVSYSQFTDIDTFSKGSVQFNPTTLPITLPQFGSAKVLPGLKLEPVNKPLQREARILITWRL